MRLLVFALALVAASASGAGTSASPGDRIAGNAVEWSVGA